MAREGGGIDGEQPAEADTGGTPTIERRPSRRSGSSASATSATGWPRRWSAPGSTWWCATSRPEATAAVSPRRPRVAASPAELGPPSPTSWWWRWSTTTRSTPCVDGPDGRPGRRPAADDRRCVVGRHHRRHRGTGPSGRGWPGRRGAGARLRGQRRSRGRRRGRAGVHGRRRRRRHRTGPAGARRHRLAGGAHGSPRHRPGGQAGPQPGPVRLVAGRLRGPGAGRGGRHRRWPSWPRSSGPATHIGGASTLMFRPTVAPLHRRPTTPGWWGPCGAAAGWPTRTCRPRCELADSLGVELPLAAMTDDRCDAVFGLGRRRATDCQRRPDGARDRSRRFGEERMLIDGELGRPSAGRIFETVNPATEEVLGVAADGTARGSRRRRRRGPAGLRRDRRGRPMSPCGSRCLRQLQAAFGAHAEELRAMTIAETGSPLSLHLLGPARRAGRRRSGGWPIWPRATSGRPTWATPRPWASRPTAGCGARPPAWSGPSRRGTSPTRSTWPSWGRPWPPATPWS